MNQELLYGWQPAIRRCLRSCAMDEDSFEMLKDVLSFGSMCGTALASPVLFELHQVWFLDVSMFLFSSAAFMLLHQRAIEIYGPFTLVAATLLGIAAYSSARTSLTELVPWLPLALCLFLLLTVYLFPKLGDSLRVDNEVQNAMEEGLSSGFYGTPVEPGSVQLEEWIPSRQWSPEINNWIEHNLSHVGGRDDQPAPSETMSTRESDVDLDEGQTVPRLFTQSMPNQNWHVTT